MPDRILYAADLNPPASGPVLITDKFRIFLFCLWEHKIRNDTQHTPFPVSACTEHFIGYVGRDCDLPGI